MTEHVRALDNYDRISYLKDILFNLLFYLKYRIQNKYINFKI
jgi:hypothetical protein